jgi:hypothetical protein
MWKTLKKLKKRTGEISADIKKPLKWAISPNSIRSLGALIK